MGKSKNAPGEITLPCIDKFPGELHRQVKSRAGSKGISFKSFVVQALRYALAHDEIIEGKPLGTESNTETPEETPQNETIRPSKQPTA